MTVLTDGRRYVERPYASGLAEVIDIILDKGMVIDVFVRVSLVGLELITIDARIVVASVDTYLRFAEAVDRVVLGSAAGRSLPDLIGDTQESGARGKVSGTAKGAVEGVKESAKETVGAGDRDRER